MTHTEVAQAFEASGLFHATHDEPYFTWRRCDACQGLPGDRYEVTGYLNLEEAKAGEGNLYTLEICPECLYRMHYGNS